jgi:hypothetical protein
MKTKTASWLLRTVALRIVAACALPNEFDFLHLTGNVLTYGILLRRLIYFWRHLHLKLWPIYSCPCSEFVLRSVREARPIIE